MKTRGVNNDRLGRLTPFRILAGVAAVLLVPLVAMQMSGEMRWSLGDFIVAAILLGSAGLMYEVLAARLETRRRRIILAAIFVVMVVVIWAEMAVGIFGSPIAGS